MTPIEPTPTEGYRPPEPPVVKGIKLRFDRAPTWHIFCRLYQLQHDADHQGRCIVIRQDMYDALPPGVKACLVDVPLDAIERPSPSPTV